jgi:hypothetical protein
VKSASAVVAPPTLISDKFHFSPLFPPLAAVQFPVSVLFEKTCGIPVFVAVLPVGNTTPFVSSFAANKAQKLETELIQTSPRQEPPPIVRAPANAPLPVPDSTEIIPESITLPVDAKPYK